MIFTAVFYEITPVITALFTILLTTLNTRIHPFVTLLQTIKIHSVPLTLTRSYDFPALIYFCSTNSVVLLLAPTTLYHNFLAWFPMGPNLTILLIIWQNPGSHPAQSGKLLTDCLKRGSPVAQVLVLRSSAA